MYARLATRSILVSNVTLILVVVLTDLRSVLVLLARSNFTVYEEAAFKRLFFALYMFYLFFFKFSAMLIGAVQYRIKRAIWRFVNR